MALSLCSATALVHSRLMVASSLDTSEVRVTVCRCFCPLRAVEDEGREVVLLIPQHRWVEPVAVELDCQIT